MEWSREAEDAVRKVPFFVRKKVIRRIEKEAAAEGKRQITMVEVNATRARFVAGMDSEIKGYQVDTCFGRNGCPNRLLESERLIAKIEEQFQKEDILGFLRRQVSGSLKFHHEFRVTVAECPNACSQPQIKDIGIIGALKPKVSDESCTGCEACMEACREGAISFTADQKSVTVDYQGCVQCGKCIDACPSGTLAAGTAGFRIQLGGKLGRHPRLARELPGVFSAEEVLEVVQQCIRFYKQNSTGGRRFAELYPGPDFLTLPQRKTC